MTRAVIKIGELVDDAVAKGAKLLLGGKRLNRPGSYFPPTVLADVPDNADMINEEIFGPVVSMQSFDDEAEAIAKANDTVSGIVAERTVAASIGWSAPAITPPLTSTRWRAMRSCQRASIG